MSPATAQGQAQEEKFPKVNLPFKTAIIKYVLTGYQKGQEISGVIIKYNKHGALASIEEGVAGLVHISEFGTPAELRESLELGKTYPFTITLFEPKDQRMTLAFNGVKKGAKK